jgi:PAS domain S-box-containing protein
VGHHVQTSLFGEAAWRALVEATPGLVFVSDVTGANTFVNARFADYAGIPAPELLGDGWLRAIHPDDRLRAAATWASSVRTGEPYETEYRFLRQDGEARLHLVRGAPQRDTADGRILGWVGTCIDVEDRHHAEAANARLAAIVTSTSDAIISFAPDDGRIQSWNRAAESLFGYTALEACGAPVGLLVPPDLPDGDATGVFARAMRGERVHAHETWRVGKSGERIPVSVTAARMIGADGRALGVSGIFRDLRAHRKAEAALAESRASLAAALDAIPQMVWSARPDGHHDYYNRRWYEFTGTRPAEAEGEGWNPCFHPDDRDRARSCWTRSLGSGEPYEVEYRLQAADGSFRWVLGRALPVRDPVSMQITRWYGTCTEIEDLVTARTALGEALDAKEALLAEVNHRVTNSLQLVSSLLSLQAARTSDAELRRGLAEAQGRIGVVSAVHRRLYQSGTHGSIDDLGTFLRDLLSDAIAAIDPSGQMRFSAELPERRLPTPIDRAVPLALAVSELVVNAVKYAYPAGRGGAVRLVLRLEPEGGLLAAVEDDGVGFPEGFDPAASRGAGMRVVLTLVRQLQARWEVGASSPMGGAAFRIHLPPSSPDASTGGKEAT